MVQTKIDKEIYKLIKEKKFHAVSSSFTPEEEMSIRRHVLESLTKKELKNIGSPVFDIKSVSSKNCENLIGKVEIPLGITGPLATTEGALVASVNRGCKAISDAGGGHTFIEQSGMTRAPLFLTKNLRQTKDFISFIKSHFKEIARKVQSTDSHLTLISITPHIAGRNVYLRFVFDTGDAMGMNMVTFACDYVIKKYIEKETKVPCIALSGNLCTDKKASWLNKIEKRGHSVHADVVIPKEVVKKVLKTNPADFVEVQIRKNLVGSALSGSLGFNSHHANIIAALFLATGQDMAHVVEGSSGMTTAELVDGGLYVSVSLPDLPIGTIGGGTGLETQKEALAILGVVGGGKPAGSNAKKFAEIIAATVLAGEISLIAALSSGDLAKAHKRLGRGEKI